MRLSACARSMKIAAFSLAGLLAAGIAAPSFGAIHIKDRSVNEPLILDQQDDYFLSKVYISGVTDVAPLTLTGKINSVSLTSCIFSNIWAGMNSKAVCAESQGAIVGSFTATDSAFEDAQNQLLCLREGAFGTVTFTRCRFKTSDQFLKKIYAEDPWRQTPPTTEFANIDRLELLDNEYTNTILVIHPSVKLVIFRGDLTNVRLQSPGTHVIRLERGQDPSTISNDGTAVANALWMRPEISEASERAADEQAAADRSTDSAVKASEAPVSAGETEAQSAPISVSAAVLTTP